MRRVASLAFALSLATILSCSEIPTAPRLGAVIVTGRITDRDGPPIAGMHVYFQAVTQSPGLPPSAHAETGTDGRYTLKVMEGAYRMNVDPGYGVGYPAVTVGVVKIGASGATVDYRYTGVRVSGTITGLDGSPLSDASVNVYGVSGGYSSYVSALSAAGQYSLLILPDTYDMYAYAGSSPLGLPRIRAGQVSILSDTTVDFTLSGFAVTATMTLTGGAPMIGAYLDAYSDDASASATTGLDGTATIYLPAGNYTIRGLPYPRNVVGPRTISRSIQADDNLIFDFAGARWDMTIRRASDGEVLSGARATLRGAGGSEFAFADVDAFGRCAFLVEPGVEYDLDARWVEGAAYNYASVPNLSSAADTTFDISVTPIGP